VAVLAGVLGALLAAAGTLFALVSGSGFVVRTYAISVLLMGAIAVWWGRRRSRGAHAPWPLRARRFAVSFCMVAALGVVAALVSNVLAMRPPGQAEVAAWLRDNKAGFERLREMLEADRLQAALDYGSEYAREPLLFRPPDGVGLTAERAAEYRRLMRAANCQRVDVWSPGTVSFAFRAWGMANRGWRVNLIWSKDEPGPLAPTIDGLRAGRPSAPNRAFSRLEGPWYAYINW
jgi:hypothetical protein